MKLMIVDDHAGARRLIRELLATAGMTVCECGSGEEAVRVARVFKPNWITMDIHLPGLNGLRATAAIQAEFPAVRIVIVSSNNQAYLRELARGAGAVGHVCKENLAELRPLFAQLVATEESKESNLVEPPPAAAASGAI